MDRFWLFLIEFVGRGFHCIFGFSDFPGFPPHSGLMTSGIVPDTRAGFRNARVRAQELNSGLVLDILGRIRGPEFWYM